MCGIIFQISDKKINTENLKKAEIFQKHRGPDFMGSKNINVIEKDCPNADVAKRFLRPDMLERLVTDKPTNRDDFIVYIPGYLRTHACATEAGKYLDDVLEIIADFESSEPEKVA